MQNKTAFTITAKNRLPSAMVCKDTFIEHNPNTDFFIFLADLLDTSDDVDLFLRSKAICFQDLHNEVDITCEELREMTTKYNVVEFNTSIKPFCIEYLLNKGYDSVLYFDPDIKFYHTVRTMWKYFEKSSVLLTPHMLKPMPDDGKMQQDINVVKAGVYNLGFFGINNSLQSRRFLKWWQNKLKHYCYDAVHQGMFVDQSWAALVTCFCNTRIIKDPTCNVAYWNLHERKLEFCDNKWKIDNNMLKFYHFSGLDYYNVDSISKFQNRYNLSNRPELKNLFYDYLADLQKYDGINRISNSYSFQKSEVPTLYGVNLIGYFPHVGGVMECSRNFTKKLYSTGIKSCLVPIWHPSIPKIQNCEEAEFKYQYSDSKFDTSLFFVNVDQLAHVYTHYPHLFTVKRRIVCPWWEIEDVPPENIENLLLADEAIVFTKFVYDIFKKYTTNFRTHLVPYPLLKPRPTRINRKKVGLCDNDFVFYTQFDYNSDFDRKNPLGIITAFSLAFRHRRSKSKLLIKTINEDAHPEKMKLLEKRIDKLGISGKTVIIDGAVTRNDLHGLIQLSDIYVSLHRSEGLGLGMLDAMCLGKPVIATAYGGNLEFMNETNSILVDYHMVSTETDFTAYAGGHWAEPDIEKAANLMHALKKNNTRQHRLSKAAKASVQKYLDHSNFNSIVHKVLCDQ